MATNVNFNSVTSKQFLAFTEDLLSYTLGSTGFDWEPKRMLNYRSAKRRRTEDFKHLPPGITPEFGDAILRLRSQHSEQFSKQLSQFEENVLDNASILVDFIYSRSQIYFKDQDFQHSFFMFNAFLFDLAFRCFEKGNDDLVETIVNSMDHVFEAHVKQQFKAFTALNAFS